MRCLVKNLAMFGLGIYIYAGEDLPEANEDLEVKKPVAIVKVAPTDEQFAYIVRYLNGTDAQRKQALDAMTKYNFSKDQMEILEGLI